jgi:heme-degrading monooxygenase HmoA
VLLGDPSKAEKVLGWKRKVDFQGLVKLMVKHDLDEESDRLYTGFEDEGPLRHIVFFIVKDGVEESSILEFIENMENFVKGCDGVLSYRVNRSMDSRKGNVVILNVIFNSVEDFEKYRKNPKHIKFAEEASRISDWLNGDYIE